MSATRSRGARLILVSVGVNVAGAVLVSILQVWSASAATPVEYIGRPVATLLLTVPLLRRLTWGRWPALGMGLSSAGWLLYSAATARLLSADGQVATGAAGIAVLVAVLLPWHPAVAAELRGRRTVRSASESPAA